MKDRVNTVSLSSVNIMMRQAKRYGAKLNLAFGALDFSVPYEYDKDLKWYHYILEKVRKNRFFRFKGAAERQPLRGAFYFIRIRRSPPPARRRFGRRCSG